MAGTPRTIQLLLLDGDARGRIKCSLTNWTGVAYLIPRTELPRCKDMAILNQTGVYLLFGKDEETGDDQVYVGQARSRKNGNGVLGRITEHLGGEKMPYWTHAVVLTTSNDSFGPTEISYLENYFYAAASLAGRYTVVNSLDPSPGNVTEEREADLREFSDYSELVIGALGFKVFDALAEEPVRGDTLSEFEGDAELLLDRSGVTARGRQTSDGFIVLEGSQIRLHLTESCPNSVRSARERHSSVIGPDAVLLEDVLFPSPSGAAGFVTGSSINGMEAWTTHGGVMLKDLETRNAADAEGGTD
ncbi:Uncharacterised protein [Streptococcus pneumoniae]|nr:Uncharacterised protein [Streptococcus pneumoniae]